MVPPFDAPSRVPAVSAYFWVIKILCTTVGETAADFLNEEMNFGLVSTSLMMALLLAAAMWFQFRVQRYLSWVYWLVVVLISVVGTLVTDNLSENAGVPLWLSTLGFGGALLSTFACWYASEETLSIRSIVTPRREAFYWAAVLLTFALGTALGDWLAEGLVLGYLTSAGLFAAVIVGVAAAYYLLRLDSVLAFWAAYILTRPLGASLGDYLSQSRTDGALGLGTTTTTALFIGTILAAVTYLSLTKRDVVGST